MDEDLCSDDLSRLALALCSNTSVVAAIAAQYQRGLSVTSCFCPLCCPLCSLTADQQLMELDFGHEALSKYYSC